jgi:hypothetical protein
MGKLKRDLQNSDFCKSERRADLASPTKDGNRIFAARRYCPEWLILQVPLKHAPPWWGML